MPTSGEKLYRMRGHCQCCLRDTPPAGVPVSLGL